MKTFPDVLEDLYASRYTGTITLHFLNGTPRRVELPAPVIDLQRDPVDKVKRIVEAVRV